MSLMEMSLAGGIIILVVTVLRAVSINRLPKGAFLCLWAVALGRLLIPYALPSSLSVYTLLERLAPAAKPVQTTVAPGLALPVAPASYVPGTVVATAPKVAPAISIDWPIVVWLVVAVAFAVFFAVSHHRCRREFYAALPVNNDMAEAFYATQPLRRKVRLRVSDRITAPLTYGVLRPVILLPKRFDWNDQEGLACALSHELYHIRRFDAVTKLVLAAALCLHWFNPAVWVMYVLANRDLELSCDEAVVRQLGPDRRRVYADALIRMEERRGSVAPLYNHFSKNAMEERIVAIMKMRKTSLAALIMAITLIVGVTVAFATTAKSPDPAQGTVVDQIIDSLDYQSDRISFTLPKSLDKPETLTIHVAGRAQYEDGFSQSLHFLEGETWEAGKTYTIPYDPSYTDLFLDVSYTNAAGELAQRNVDLLAAEKYDPDDLVTASTTSATRVDPITGQAVGHNGVDIAAPAGTSVFAAHDGEVVTAEFQDKYGNHIILDRGDGMKSLYAHLSKMTVSVGDRVEAGQVIGAVGSTGQSTGPHLHFALYQDDVLTSFDPSLIASVTEVADAVALGQPAPEKEIASDAERTKTLLEEYVPFGLSYDIDPSTGKLNMSWQGKPVHSVYDRKLGVWIAESMRGLYLGPDAVDLQAVYDSGGNLTGVEEAPKPVEGYADRSQAELLAEYGPYGISFDSAGNMLYEGVVIGLFVDGVELQDGGWAMRYVYQSDVGAQCLIALRDRRDNGDGSYDPFGPLTGIRAMTDEELAELSQVGAKTTPNLEAVAVMAKDAAIEDDSVDFRDAFNEKFKPYGVSFVPSGAFGNVYWNGQRVSVFEDAAPDGSYQTLRSVDGGEVSLRAVYDAQGNLTGVVQS